MSVYVGIDVHRKRSQVAVIDGNGEVLANRNVPNGVEPILKVIGGLPTGTPAAFEAAYGTSWTRCRSSARNWRTGGGAIHASGNRSARSNWAKIAAPARVVLQPR